MVTYVSSETDPDPEGQTIFYPEEKLSTLYDSEVFPIPEGGTASYTGKEDPKTPNILIPSEIILNVNKDVPEKSFETFEIPFKEFILHPLPTYTTEYGIVLENRSKEDTISQLDVLVVGDTLDSLEVTLENLSSFDKDPPTFKIKIPTSEESLKYYKQSPKGSIVGTFDILYLGVVVDKGSKVVFEVFRQNYYFMIPLQIINSKSVAETTEQVADATRTPSKRTKTTISPLPKEYFDTSPAGIGKVSVYNKRTGTTSILSENLATLKGGTVNTFTRKLSTPRRAKTFGPKSYQNIEKRSTPNSETIEKLKRTEYSNGIKSSQYAFFDNFSFAPLLKQPYRNNMNVSGSINEGGISIFNRGVVDFTVATIQKINTYLDDYNDFVYNALTSDRIKNSISREVTTSLIGKFNLDGTSFIDTLSSAMRTALIAGEDNYFSRAEIHKFIGQWGFNADSLVPSSNAEVNYTKAVEIISNNPINLAPDYYDIINKNRLLNWKVLAEDAKKYIRVRIADGTETRLLIPNSETLTVYDSTGSTHTLEMQDGNYFDANPVVGDDRLTVFIGNSVKILKTEDLAKTSRLLNQKYTTQLTCTSLESDLLEFNVDVTGTREDYYFLKVDKSTISDSVPDDPLFRKTTATYNYITDITEINSFIKHRAFPNFVVYLRSDDIIFNYLEKTLQASFSFIDPSLTTYLSENRKGEMVRRFPWYVVVIPTDMTEKIPTQARSVLKDFSTRTISLEPAPLVRDTTYKPMLIGENVTPTGSINYDTDIENRITYQEDREYVTTTSALSNVRKYRTGSEVVPRKLHPTNVVLQKINEMKTAFSLTENDSISFYDLFTRLEPKVVKSLLRDHELGAEFLRKLRINKVANTESINKEKFVALRDIPQTGINTTGPLLSTKTMRQKFTKITTAGIASVPQASVGTVAPVSPTAAPPISTPPRDVRPTPPTGPY